MPLRKTMASATRGDTLPVMPSKARHLILFVIPAKAGIQSIYKEEWIPFYKGMTEENPGSPIRSGMTVGAIRSGMTIYFPDQVGMTFYSSFPNVSIGNPYPLVIPKVLILHLRNLTLYKDEIPRRYRSSGRRSGSPFSWG